MKASELYSKSEDDEGRNVKKLMDAKRQGGRRDYSALMDNVQMRGRLNPLSKLFRIIIKNYKILIRTRTSALIFLLGPLLIMALVSIGFNTSTLYGVNIASYSESYSPLAEALISNLSSGEYIIQKVETQDKCMNAVKLGEYPVCILFPNDMAVDNSARNVITLYIDESRLNIANAITEKLSSKVAVQADALSMGAVSQILNALDNINREAEAAKSGSAILSSNNAEEASTLATALSSIEDFDLTASAIDTSGPASEISSIQSRLNLSSSEFTALTASVNTVINEYNSIRGKLDTAKTNAGAVQENTVSAKNKVNADTAIIRDVNAKIDTIKTNVGSVKITNVESIVSPIKISVQPLTKTKNYFIYILPALLILLIMLVSLLISSTGVIREKESSASLRNFITPTSPGTFLLAHYLTYISIIGLQSAIMLGVTRIFIKDVPFTTYLLALALLVIFATLFIFIGMFIGTIFNTGESATVASVSIAIITLVFSNSILPLETLSGFLRLVVEYNPFVMMEKMLKGLFLFEASIASMTNLYLILGFIGGAALITIVLQIMREKLMR
ncbi:MAG: ABC transporter permease [Nanoarchaeota archaeon]|nr:ABC transporter permease [Nanoarchaeota archaeon]